MKKEINIKRTTSAILSSFSIILSGFIALTNFSEWYIVKIQNDTANYPFGGVGGTPYYYKTAELYSIVNLIWGYIFFTVFLLEIWSAFKNKKELSIVLFGITLSLTVGLILHGQIGVN